MTKPSKRQTSYFSRLWSQKWLRVSVYIVGFIFLLSVCSPLWYPVAFPPVKDPRIGVSFSEKRSKEMGLDWRANYLALLDDMQIKHLRLMSYWDIHEPSRGQFDFSSLDWQIEEAAKRGADVSLAIGLRQPRWPECHEPMWAGQLTGGEWKQALYSYVETVVTRYEHNPTVTTWQLENEGANVWFGECGEVDLPRIQEEFDMVKRISHKPVWMSLSDQHSLPVGVPVADKFGYSVYRTVWNNKTPPFNFYITYPAPLWWHHLRGGIIKTMTGRDIFIHELQLEPWGPGDTITLSREEQDRSMDSDQIQRSFLFARQIGARDIYTWGGEWWYWRKVQGDPSIWNSVKHTFEEAQSQ